MESTPLILPTVVVLIVAAVEWPHTRWVAWTALASGFVLLTAVMRYPALTAAEILDFGATLVAVPMAAARAIAVACFLFTVVRTIRTSGIPW